MDFLKDFGVQPILLAAQVVNFLILLFILKKLLYAPILKVLDERKKRIEQSLKNADEIAKRLVEANEEYEKILAKGVNDSQKLLDETKAAAAAMLDDVKQTAVEIVKNAQDQAIEVAKSEKEKMVAEVKDGASDLIIAVFQKITGKIISKEDQKKMIEREIKNLS